MLLAATMTWTAVVFSVVTHVTMSHPHCSTPGLCSNGGTCVETINSIFCLCPPGFTGPSCADTDHCSSSPCQNGGQCFSLTASYSCACASGFTGSRCQTAVSPCDSSPCLHGQCRNLGQGYECLCAAGYADVNCDVELDYCSSAPCGHHGKCVEENTGGYSCHCDSDYLGLNCEQAIDQQCGQHEESFCMCEVNGSPVKVPIPEPAAPFGGIRARDCLLGLTGLLIGWMLGTGIMTLFRCCCQNAGCLGDCFCVGAGRRYPSRPVGVRPASSASTVSTLDSLRSDTPDSSSAHSTAPRRPSDLSSSAHSRDSGQRPMNVYRAGFTDSLSHQTAVRKSGSTYTSGQKDW